MDITRASVPDGNTSRFSKDLEVEGQNHHTRFPIRFTAFTRTLKMKVKTMHFQYVPLPCTDVHLMKIWSNPTEPLLTHRANSQSYNSLISRFHDSNNHENEGQCHPLPIENIVILRRIFGYIWWNVMKTPV